MKTVYLVRHGESEENVSSMLHGARSPLTEKGMQQAASLAERAKRLRFDVLISSPMVRAHETARVISEQTGHQAETSDLFVERQFPSHLTGLDSNEPDIREQMSAWSASMYEEGPTVGDGEDFGALRARALAALTYLEGRPEDRILLGSNTPCDAWILFSRAYGGHRFRRYADRFRAQEIVVRISYEKYRYHRDHA
jgi:broad specificity phosphatase PhoE